MEFFGRAFFNGVADLKRGINSSERALLAASMRGKQNGVVDALAKGAAPSVQDEDGNSPIIWAATYGFTEIVKLLLEHGVDVNQRGEAGNTALMMAVKYGREDTVVLLLESGAKKTIRNDNHVSALELVPAEHERIRNALASKLSVRSR